MEFASHAEAIARFIEEFELRAYGLVPAIFDDAPDPTLASIPLAPAALADSYIFSLLVPPVSAAVTVGTGTTAASTDADPDDATWDVDRADILSALTGLQGIEEAAFRAMSALRAGMHVIFTGPPGTGKTQLAQRLCQASGIPWTLAAATDQWTTIDTIGGYFPSSTSAGQLDFLPGFVTNAIANRRTLIVDEINRADIDKAFGELFTLLSGNSVDLPYLKRVDTTPPSTRRIKLGDEETPDDPSMEIIRRPSWWRLIGSMNDADKASLKRLSYAFIRRFAFIPVDVPPQATYEALIDSGAGAGPDGLAATRPDFLVVLKALFADPSGLASYGMAMGYAVPEAMMRHARSELAFEPTRQTDDLLASSLELFVAPQFQGRADKHEDFIKNVGQHLKTPALLSRFRSRLSVWTGYVD